jgi:hypothetical protein
VRLLAVLVALPIVAAAAPGEVIRVEHHDPKAAPMRGAANAPVTIELFFIPGSANRVQIKLLEQLQAEHPSRVRLVYRPMQRGTAGLSSLAALEAEAQGRFAEMLDELGRERSTPDRDRLIAIGGRIGMDPRRLDLALRTANSYRDVLYQVIVENDHRFNRMLPKNTGNPNVLINSRPLKTPFANINEAQLRTEYQQAYDHALDLIDRGISTSQLTQAFDQEALAASAEAPIAVSPLTTDDDAEGLSQSPILASPPIDATGLPSSGSAKAPLAIVILCNPAGGNGNSCKTTLTQTHNVKTQFPHDVRLVWAPFFDVSRDDASALAQLGDAALCAEQLGIGQADNFPPDYDWDSPGWRWTDEMLREASRVHNRQIDPNQLIDRVAQKLKVDSQKLSSCRARMAGTTFERISRARHSGVRTAPSVIIGGRIYSGGISEPTAMQSLVEAELAPGALAGREISLDRLLLFFGGGRRSGPTQ